MSDRLEDQRDDEEDVTELKFTKEFQNERTLLHAEVARLLEDRKRQNDAAEDTGEGNEVELGDVFLKTLSYCQRFGRYKSPEAVKAIREIFKNKNFHNYEIAQLCNLCPETCEEAISLIPSLDTRFDDEELQEILDDILSKRDSYSSKSLNS